GSSGPGGEAQTRSGARRRAVAGHVFEPVEFELLKRACYRNPVEDLRTAGMELVPRQALQERGVLVSERLEDRAVKFLVYEEVTQTAVCEDADACIARKALNCLLEYLSETIAALRSGPVRFEIRVQKNWHHRQRLLDVENMAMDIGDRVALAFSF